MANRDRRRSQLLQLLGKRCTQDHEHQPLMNGRAAAAAIYPPALCRAMLRGIEAQRRREGEPMLSSVLCGLDEEENAAREARRWAQAYPA